MSDESAKEWLNTNWPNMHACDVNWTMKRYDYPDHVCEYIKNHWIKISDSGGGTYQQKYDYKKCLDETHILWRTENQKKMQKELDEEENHQNPKIKRCINNWQRLWVKLNQRRPSGKAAAKLYQQTGFAKAMDEPNKKALDVMANEGMDAAVKHMFIDQESGRQLSYAEMRSRYG